MSKNAFTPQAALRPLLAAAFLTLLPGPAAARYYYSWEKKPEKTFSLKTRVRRWQTATSAMARGGVFTPASWWIPQVDHVKMGTTMDFKVMDAPVYLFSAEVQPLRGFYLEFETGDNKFSEGKYFEHDWLHAPDNTLYLLDGVVWEAPHHRDYAKKRAEISGSARQYSASAYLNVYKTDALPQDDWYELEHSLDIFLGYSYYESRARLFNGYKIVSTDFFLPTPPAGPITGLDSRARMLWHGWRGGLRERVLLGKDLSAEARFAFAPRMSHSAEYRWNVNPNLADPGERITAYGTQTEFELSLSWNFWKKLRADAGWLISAYRSSKGEDTLYNADGSVWTGELDRVAATRKGLFLGLTWQY